ncbi:MAG: glycosyltransferase family 9 protein [Lonepinella koalarum]|nr:glycosyltransferase family 9 protein [Lonepinella koalarum]
MSLFNQPPKSLCILRLSAIGDVCHALAAVQQIQDFYPECKITWIIGKTEASLLSAITQGIEFVVYDKKTGWHGVWNLWKTLKNQQFDALLNMQTAFRASILSLGIKAKIKLGFGKKRSREGQGLFVNYRISDPQSPHVLDGLLAFAQSIGVPIQSPYWHIQLAETDKYIVNQYVDPQRKNLLISPCSSKVEKDWLTERYAELANWANQQGFNVILSGSNAVREQKTIEKLTALCDFHPTNTAGKTTLPQLAALIQSVDLVISPDSGAAHIATMVGTPVIGLYAYHNPLRTGPYYNLANVVSVYEQHALKEFGKSSAELPWATKLKGENLMADISVEQVKTKIMTFK